MPSFAKNCLEMHHNINTKLLQPRNAGIRLLQFSIWIALCFLVLPAALRAQQTMSLEDCIAYAQTNNPQVKAAQLAITDAEWRIKESKYSGFPQLTAGITYSGFIQRGGLPSSALSFGPSGPVEVPQIVKDNFTQEQQDGLFALLGTLFASDPDSKLYFAPVHSVSGNVQLSQLIFNNSYLVALKAARYYRDYVNLQMDGTKRTLRNQVTDAYLPALLISENLGILDKNISNLEKLLNDTKAINKAGFAEQLDVDRLELSLATLRSERGNLARQQEVVVNVLKMVMGMPIANNLALSDNVEKLLAADGEPDLTTPVNYMNRNEYTQLLKGRDLSALQTDLYRRPFLPTVAGFLQYQPGLQGGFGDKNSPTFKDWYFIPAAVGGLSVNFTLWDSGVNNARKQRAIIATQTIETQKAMLENAIAMEVDNARKQYLNATERVRNQQQNLDLAQRIYDTIQKKYKAGVGSSFEITQAEQSVYAAQQGLMSARFDLLSAKVAIKKAMGQ